MSQDILEQEIEITYSLNKKLYLDACFDQWNNNSRSIIETLLIISILILLGISYIFYTTWFLLFIVCLMILFMVMRQYRVSAWHRNFYQPDIYKHPIKMKFGSEAINVEMSQMKAILQWNFYDSYYETGEYFVLYINKHWEYFWVIPKKELSDEKSKKLSELFAVKIR